MMLKNKEERISFLRNEKNSGSYKGIRRGG